MFLPELKAKRGGRIEKTTTSKGLMHSNDYIKEKWATIEGGEHPPTLLWGNHCGLAACILVNTAQGQSVPDNIS